MAGHSLLCSGPEEILLYIVEQLQSPDDLDLHHFWPHRQAIRFVNDRVLGLAQVNHLFRRLCLPLLYEHIFIRLTDANPTAYESPHSLQLDLFRRTMERKPHLADLVRVIKIRGYSIYYYYTSRHVFDSLPFLPKIKQIHFPPNIRLDLDFLSVINSHPSLLTVHWEITTTNNFTFPNTLSLPHGALSRVLIDREELSEASNSIELLWLYFSELGLRVKDLTIKETTPPPFLSLTYPDLCEIDIDVGPVFSSDSPRSLEWFPSFLERHPQLKVFSISLDQCEGYQAWEALKNVPIIRPLYDASHSRGLISSFSITSIEIVIEGFSSSSVDIDIDLPRDLPEIIHLLGSLVPIPKVTLYFCTPELHSLPINVNDFVSAFQNYKTLSWLSLYDVHLILDLNSLSTDEELHINNTSTKVSNPRLLDHTEQLAQLTRLLNAGLPQLQEIIFS